MANMPRSLAQHQIRAARRQLAAGEIDETTARELTAHIREAQAARMWAAALNAAQEAGRG